MHRIILRAVLVGIVAGLLVGVYHNIFTVPIIERAIVLEEERAAAEQPAAPASGEQAEEEPPLVSLGMQRIGMAIGMGILGAVFGLVFAGTYGLLRWALPDSRPIALAIVSGLLGFWALSFLVSVKYPFVPPGVGSEDTLLFRQGFQLLFYIMSALGVAGIILALNEIRSSALSQQSRQWFYLLAALVYGAFLLLIFWLVPGNPDSVPVPADLFLQFQQCIANRTPADMGADGSRLCISADERPD